MKKTILILSLIILIALAFGLPAILGSGSFWFDEMVSLKIAQHNILNSWQYLKWENNPPLHYWFLHYWIKVFGTSEIILRLSSLLFSLLSILVISFLGKKLFNRQVGFIAAFLLSISAFQLFISMDARMYPMLLFFSLLSSYYFWQILYQPHKKNWLLYILFTLLALYTHLTAFYLFIIQNIYFIYHYKFVNKKQPTILQWAVSQFTIFLLFLPWLLNFAIRSLSTLNSGAWYLHTTGGGFLLFQIPISFFFLGYQIPLIELIVFIFFTLLLVLSLVKVSAWSPINKEFKVKLILSPAVIFCWLLFLIPLFCGFLIQMWVAKYYLISMIGLLLILASGFEKLKIKIKIKFFLLACLLILIIPFNLYIIKNNKHSWRLVASYVQSIAEPQEPIIISAFVYQLPFDYYYHGQGQVVAFAPVNLESDILLRAVKYNWQPVLTSQNMPPMELFIKEHKKIIIINPSRVELVHKSNLVIDWFIKHNWKLVVKKQFGGFIQPTVLVFQRPTR